MTRLVIVNGRPRAGKDTFVAMLSEELKRNGIPVADFSSIDPVRDMLQRAGIDLSAKTEDDRRLLAVVGDAVEAHSNWRSLRCVEAIDEFRAKHSRQGVFFLHVREPAVIETIQWNCELTMPEIRFTTVLLQSPRAEHVTSNDADAGVMDMVYDQIVHNNGTLEDLRRKARIFVHGVVLEES